MKRRAKIVESQKTFRRDCKTCKARNKCLLYEESKKGFGFSITEEVWQEECKRQYENIVNRKQQSCDDCISRQEALNVVHKYFEHYLQLNDDICLDGLRSLPSVTPKEKTKHCKDCKWWKDNDGVYRRGVNAESNCPINSRTVYEGNGYCFMFEPQESEEEK